MKKVPYDWGPPKLEDRNGYFKVEAKDPRYKKSLWNVFISNRKRDECNSSPFRMMELAHTVRETLLYPYDFFMGFRESYADGDDPGDEFKYGIVYVGNPDRRYFHVQGRSGESNECEYRTPDRVICIFMKANRHVVGWDWIERAPDDDCLPIDYKTRFTGGRLKLC